MVLIAAFSQIYNENQEQQQQKRTKNVKSLQFGGKGIVCKGECGC